MNTLSFEPVVRRRVAFLLVLGVAAFTGRAYGEDPGAGQACTAGCHEEVANENAKHKPLSCVQCHPNVAGGKQDHAGAMDEMPAEKVCAQAGCHPETTARQRSGVHKDSGCESCHGFVHEDFRPWDKSACKGCHGAAVKAFNESVHARAGRPVDCADCHGDIHDVKKASHPLAPMSKVLQVTTCSECHDSGYVRAYRDSVHGRGVLVSGLTVAPTCSDCHGSHGIAKTHDPASRVSRQNITATCGTCHTFIVTRWRTSAHGHLLELEAKGQKLARQGPVCSNCHPGHRTFDPTVEGKHLQMADTCGGCHPDQNESYRDSFHGKATRLGLRVAATCADCHTPHEMLPAKDPRSSVSPANELRTCQHCHPSATASFIEFEPHIKVTRPTRNATVHHVWMLMTALLLGVFGFSTVHTMLWLQRSIVALVRGELPRTPHDEGDVWIRRFRGFHIWIHLTIIATFLLLSATGLPIKFNSVPWARQLELMLGGVSVTRVLHRVAGMLTFGYGLFFVGYLVREIAVKKRWALLWGWQSMLPNRKDATDLWHNVLWFLYRGPRPRLDRWSYWEKFDFFAVFWGIPVIGLSGLALWFPTQVANYLPGWVLNVAYLVHSDEALLATGFIFFFHFFHTHLRPEAFPLDTVIFLGAMPLERFKEERPAEYERLEQSGEIEELKVPRPEDHLLRRAKRIGFTALAIGVLLGTILLIAGFMTLTD